MQKPSVFLIILKDLFDFLSIFCIAGALTGVIYSTVPGFVPIELSFSFPEQLIELLYLNPKLVLWFFGLAFGVTIIYFLFGAMLCGTTAGGFVFNLLPYDSKTLRTVGLIRSVVMAIGAFLGVVFVFIGPLSAWWLDSDHRGFAEKLAATVLRKRVNSAP